MDPYPRPPPITCEVCDKVFKAKSSLLIHKRIHTGEKPYKCSFCGRKFMYLSSINVHMVSKHKNENATTKTTTTTENNTNTVSKSNRTTVNNSRKTNKTTDNVIKKVNFSPTIKTVNFIPKAKTVTNQKIEPNSLGVITTRISKSTNNVWPDDERYKCNLCPRSFESIKGLNGHKNQHYKPEYNADNKFRCSKCENVFINLDAVIAHQSEHVEGHFFKCTPCGISFKHKASLICHARVHGNDRPYKCQKCNKTFKTNFQLLFHQNTNHMPTNHACTVCGKLFPQKYKLELHMRAHTGGTTYRCGLCDEVFPTLELFRKHKEAHLKPKQCTTCKKRFNSATQLAIHTRIHNNERPFSCTSCGAKFKQSHHLKVHLAIHIERAGRPHKCVQCGAAFSQTHLLKKHIMRVHWKEDDNVNKKKLVEASNSKADDISDQDADDNHAETSDDGGGLTPKQHFCDICGTGFTRRYNLTHHIAKHLGNLDQKSPEKITSSGVSAVSTQSVAKTTSPVVPVVLNQSVGTVYAGGKTSPVLHNVQTTAIYPMSKYTPYKFRQPSVLKQVLATGSSGFHRKIVRESIQMNYYVPRSLVNTTAKDPSTGKTVYVCEVCSTTFTFKENLIRHIRNRPFDHGFYLRKKTSETSKEVPYVAVPAPPSPPPPSPPPEPKKKKRHFCDVCELSYSRRNNMLMHRRKHTDIEFKEAGFDRNSVYRPSVAEKAKTATVDTVSSSTSVGETEDIKESPDPPEGSDTSECPVYMDRDDVAGGQESSKTPVKNDLKKTVGTVSNNDCDKDGTDETADQMDDFNQEIDNDFASYSSDGETQNERIASLENSLVTDAVSAQPALTIGTNKACLGCALPILDDQTTMTCQLCCQKHCLTCSGVSKDVHAVAFADESVGFVWMCKICKPLFPKLTVMLEQMGDFEQALNNRMSDLEKKLSVIEKH